MQKRISEIINDNFKSLWIALKDPKYTTYVSSGGRASAKSFHISLFLILAIMKEPITILCIRKVANTLKGSVFEQLKEAIMYLNVEHLFIFKTSPLEIIYKPRGNSIIFRGADDPTKIKSIKASKYPIAYCWFEECAELKTEDEYTIIKNSILRAKLKGSLNYKIIITYNPPKRKSHWLNENYSTATLISDKTYVHHSTYLENPHISQEFIDEAEECKRRNEMKYRWEYLGEPVGSGVVPFNNLQFREITPQEIKSFDNIIQAIDWGYSVDPLAFNRMHYDSKKRILYIFDEYHKVKCSNRELIQWLKKKKYHRTYTTADSSEPKSIAELKNGGINIRGAKKGQGSVEYGEKWLDDLEAIVIDPRRCPHTAREFNNIDYQTDARGETIPRLEDKDNHHIDATRYGCERFMKSKKSFF